MGLGLASGMVGCLPDVPRVGDLVSIASEHLSPCNLHYLPSYCK